ncbi:cupin domain-containing protein [Martelella alba]|uniref:cupin domain-containing protein n=1 Tax=Martelella alba TaxID=2590451 RepID=UPI001E2DF6C6|nr:cupin domain-containing protein [Martelella alba]
MYQRWFDNQTDTLFEKGMTPKLSRYVISDDPHWESGLHVHDVETELMFVKKGVVRLTIDASSYVARAGEIIAIEHGCLHSVASDRESPATTCTCAVVGFKIRGLEENRIMQPHSCPVVSRVKNINVLEGVLQELDDLLLRQGNNNPAAIFDALGYTLTALFYENFKSAYRTGAGYLKKDALVKDILMYLNNNYRQKITLDHLAEKFHASVSYICHEFTKEYHISPINYVIKRRLTEAKLF